MQAIALIFFVFRYVEPLIIEILLGSLMAIYPRFFAGIMFNDLNDYTDITLIFLGFMVLAFGIVHLGFFHILSKSGDRRFQSIGLKILMICLFLGDIVHILLMGVLIAWKYSDKNIIASPRYYYQFALPILLMQGRIYVMKNSEDIIKTNFYFSYKV